MRFLISSEVINYFSRREGSLLRKDISGLNGRLSQDFNINQRLMNINKFKFLVDLLFSHC